MNQTINQRITLVNASKRAAERARLKGWDIHPKVAKDLGDELDNRMQVAEPLVKLIEKIAAWVVIVVVSAFVLWWL